MRSLGRALAALGVILVLCAFALVIAASRPSTTPARTPGSAAAVPVQVAAGTDATSAVSVPAGTVAGASVQAPSLPGFAGIAQAVLPSVVTVTSTEVLRANPRGAPFGGGSPFDFFFGPGRGTPQDRKQVAGGSGFLITPDGEILTNNHVVAGAQKVEIKLHDRRVFTAKILGTDPVTDIALIKIDSGAALPTVPLGDSDALHVGDWVMAVGNPLMFEGTVTVGVISGIARRGLSDNADAASFENFLQTDAAINPGNSGGPLIDASGRVVGINSAMIQPAQNIGFAVAINTAKAIVPQLKSKGKVVRGMLGVQITEISEDIMKAFGLPSMDGAFVESVSPDGPAAKAGVQNGDTIVGVDDRPVKQPKDAIDYVSAGPPGKAVSLTVLRGGKTLHLTATLGERRIESAGEGEEGPASSEGTASPSRQRLGVQVAAMSPEVRQQLNLPPAVAGVVVARVAQDSPLGDQGVAPGDVITEVNGAAVKTRAEFEGEVAKVRKGDYLRLYVRRFDPQEISRFVVVRAE
ncbi:MAG TPA: Do family serine endopeptidase [Thermoanaerobaculia bacterium]